MSCRKCQAGRRGHPRRHHRRCPLRGIGRRSVVTKLLWTAFGAWADVCAAHDYGPREKPTWTVQSIRGMRRLGDTGLSAQQCADVAALLAVLPANEHIAPDFDVVHEAAVARSFAARVERWPTSALAWLLRYRLGGDAATAHVLFDRMSVAGGKWPRLPFACPVFLVAAVGCDLSRQPLLVLGEWCVYFLEEEGRRRRQIRFVKSTPPSLFAPPSDVPRMAPFVTLDFERHACGGGGMVLSVFVGTCRPDERTLNSLVDAALRLCHFARYPGQGAEADIERRMRRVTAGPYPPHLLTTVRRALDAAADKSTPTPPQRRSR